MSYTMRFILTDGAGPTLQELESVLKAKKPAYAIEHERDASGSGCAIGPAANTS